MNNELIPQKTLWRKPWVWVCLTLFLFLIGIGGFIVANTNGQTAHFAQAIFGDTALFDMALEKTKEDERTVQVFGELEAIDKMAIVEGDVQYSNNNNEVQATVRVKGSKGKGKMDITATRKGDEWEYNKIVLRTQNPEVKIIVLNE